MPEPMRKFCAVFWFFTWLDKKLVHDMPEPIIFIAAQSGVILIADVSSWLNLAQTVNRMF